MVAWPGVAQCAVLALTRKFATDVSYAVVARMGICVLLVASAAAVSMGAYALLAVSAMRVPTIVWLEIAQFAVVALMVEYEPSVLPAALVFTAGLAWIAHAARAASTGFCHDSAVHAGPVLTGAASNIVQLVLVVNMVSSGRIAKVAADALTEE